MNIELITLYSKISKENELLDTRYPLLSALKRIADVTITPLNNYSPSIGDEYNSLYGEKIEIFFILSGGTEESFISIAHRITEPIIIMCDGYYNSLAAGLEISSWLHQHNFKHELINIPMEFSNLDFLQIRLSCIKLSGLLSSINSTSQRDKINNCPPLNYFDENIKDVLSHSVIGLIGGESNWLVASHIDRPYIERTFNVRFVDIDINEVVTDYNTSREDIVIDERFKHIGPSDDANIREAIRFSNVLINICKKYSLTALTINCFDALDTCKTTACLSLSILNDMGIPSGCEGDIPSLWTMIVAKAYFGKDSFMANPSSSVKEEHSIDFAHCSIPFSLVSSFKLPTHFESGIGVGIEGVMKTGRYSIMKIGGEKLNKLFYAEGRVICNTTIKQRCRTQIRFQFDSDEDFDRFFLTRLGNHIILTPLE